MKLRFTASMFATGVACFLIGAVAADARGATAQTDRTLENFRNARLTLDKAIEATGGPRALGAITSVGFDYENNAKASGQSGSPTHDDDWTITAGTIWIDTAGNRSAIDAASEFRGGLAFHTKTVLTGKAAFIYDAIGDEYYELSPFDFALAKGGLFGQPHRFFPSLLLQEAAARAATLRWLGRERIQGADHDLVSFSDADGNTFTLSIHATSRRVTRLGILSSNPLLGDVSLALDFGEPKRAGEYVLPQSWTASVAGEITGTWTATNLRVNAELDDAIFTKPEDRAFVEKGQIFAPQPLAEGVTFHHLWLPFANTYNTMVVEFEDHLMIMDAPLAEQLSQFFIGFCANTFPGKPIRYLMATHYHGDHVGGIRAHVMAKTTVIATSEASRHIRKLCSVDSSLKPFAVASNEPFSYEFDIVAGRRTYGDATREVVVYDIGPTPHVDEMLVAYLPAERILYVADMFGTSPTGEPRGSNPSTEFLKKKIAELGLEVETLVPGHGLPTPYADFERITGAE